MTTRIGLVTIVATVLAAGISDPGPAQPATRAVREVHLKTEQALPLTCVQAWIASGKQYSKMLGIVTTLAKVSLANRSLRIPNTREAGLDAGRGIAEDCKADPDALLFAIVDKHVRRVAMPAAR